MIDVAERQWAYVEQLLALLADGSAREIAASADALARYEQQRIEAARNTVWASGCV